MLIRCVLISLELTLLTTLALLGLGAQHYALSKASVPWIEILASPGLLLDITYHGLVLLGLGGVMGGAAWLLLQSRLFLAASNSGVLAVLAVLLVHVGMLHLNAEWFSHSQLYEYGLHPATVIGWPLVFVTLVLMVDGLLVSIHRHRSGYCRRRIWLPVAALSAAALSLGLISNLDGDVVVIQGNPGQSPDVILIGVDSLNIRVFEQLLAAGELPNIEAYLHASVRYTDAFTPIGQTYSAWVSILTGLNPAGHGVRYNLAAMSQARTDLSIAHDFRERGYHTVYAIDERRFSNLNEAFGFDVVVGPRGGAADFVAGTFGESPGTNLLAGKPVLPHVHMNRAIAHAYRPQHFDRALESAIAATGDRPLFLAVHYCIAHYPYFWRDLPRYESHARGDELNARPSYIHAVRAADRQVGALLGALETRGRLENAIVVFLSDHGEAFALEWDVIDSADDAGPRIEPYWHGTNTFSIDQNAVMLAFSTPETRAGIDAAESFDTPASLIDIAPTLREWLGWPQRPSDGVALYRDKWTGPDADGKRSVVVEVGFTPTEMQSMRSNPERAASGVFHFYRTTRAGLLEMKLDVEETLLETKERAIVQGDWIIRALPYPELGLCEVQVMNRRENQYWSHGNEPAVARGATLLERLCESYPDDERHMSLCCSA